MVDLDTAINIIHCLFIGTLQLASAFLFYGGQRYARRKYHKLHPEVNMENYSTNMEGALESAAASSDITSSEASEPETDLDEAEALTCNVCDRAFLSIRHLAAHQQKRRHFGCSACESVFPSLMALEHHKESLEHWTDDGGDTQDDSEDDSEDDSDDSQQEVGMTREGSEESGIVCGVAAERERLL